MKAGSGFPIKALAGHRVQIGGGLIPRAMTAWRPQQIVSSRVFAAPFVPTCLCLELPEVINQSPASSLPSWASGSGLGRGVGSNPPPWGHPDSGSSWPFPTPWSFAYCKGTRHQAGGPHGAGEVIPRGCLLSGVQTVSVSHPCGGFSWPS